MIKYLVFLGMGICTFLPRYLPLVVLKDREFSLHIKTALGYVTPAVLAAIVVPELIMPGGAQMHFSIINPYIVAGGITILSTLLTKRVLLSSFIGIGVFFLLQWSLQ
jgi:branched-subunit amino acid transport protein